MFKDAGADIALASPRGGQPPIDPSSDNEYAQTDDTEALQQLATTLKLSDVTDDGFDAIFHPGGYEPLWDLVKDADSKRRIDAFAATNRPIGAVCHAPAVFCHIFDTGGRGHWSLVDA